MVCGVRTAVCGHVQGDEVAHRDSGRQGRRAVAGSAASAARAGYRAQRLDTTRRACTGKIRVVCSCPREQRQVKRLVQPELCARTGGAPRPHGERRCRHERGVGRRTQPVARDGDRIRGCWIQRAVECNEREFRTGRRAGETAILRAAERLHVANCHRFGTHDARAIRRAGGQHRDRCRVRLGPGRRNHERGAALPNRADQAGGVHAHERGINGAERDGTGGRGIAELVLRCRAHARGVTHVHQAHGPWRHQHGLHCARHAGKAIRRARRDANGIGRDGHRAGNGSKGDLRGCDASGIRGRRRRQDRCSTGARKRDRHARDRDPRRVTHPHGERAEQGRHGTCRGWRNSDQHLGGRTGLGPRGVRSTPNGRGKRGQHGHHRNPAESAHHLVRTATS